MIKLFAKISSILLLIILSHSTSAFSQSECRSILAAHLKPIGKSPLSWAVEETFAQGWMTDRNITNDLLYIGLDFTLKSHSVYFEGGYKGWRNSLGTQGQGNGAGNGFNIGNFGLFQQNRLGIREAYYMYNHKYMKIIAGLHTTQLDDYFLVDERALGIDFKQSFGALSVNANVSTVLRDFVRMGNFCTVKYIYNTIKGKYEPYIGEGFGETNFSSLVISWNPSEKGTWKHTEDTDFEEFETFSEDEFKDFNESETDTLDEFKSVDDEFVETETKTKKSNYNFSDLIEKYGFVVYEEFGDSVPNFKSYYGAMIGLNLPYKFNLSLEALNQTIEDENTIGYFVKLEKNFNWKPGLTSLNLIYTGKYNITGTSSFYASYSNLYMGEVMRLDLWDMPLAAFELKHNFKVRHKPFIQIKVAEQFIEPYTSAFDVKTGLSFFKHCKLTGIFSRIQSDALPDNVNYLIRFELRVAF